MGKAYRVRLWGIEEVGLLPGNRRVASCARVTSKTSQPSPFVAMEVGRPTDVNTSSMASTDGKASDPHAWIGWQSRGIRVAGRFVGQDRAMVSDVAGECYSVGHLRLFLPVGSYEQVNVGGLVVVWRPLVRVVLFDPVRQFCTAHPHDHECSGYFVPVFLFFRGIIIPINQGGRSIHQFQDA